MVARLSHCTHVGGPRGTKKKIVVDKLRSTKNNEQDQYSLSGPDFATWDAKMDRS